jgi:hypothetical protein
MLDIPADRGQKGTPGPTRPLPADFVETATPEITVPELLARVQEEVARRRQAASSQDAVPGSFLGTGRRSRTCLDWGLITLNLHIAQKNVHVGKDVPQMTRFPGPIRVLARLLAWGILHVLRMITNPQREFNQAVVNALLTLRDGVRQLEKANQQAFADLEERLVAVSGVRNQESGVRSQGSGVSKDGLSDP